MKGYPYKKLDAFASELSAGNPAACLYIEALDALTRDEMQTIAAQHKGFVSEVVYCGRSKEADFDLVYYSSECEVDFCGHGTIACMYSLICSDGSLLKKPRLTIRTKKGLLTVYNEIAQQDAVFIAAPAPVYNDARHVAGRIAQALTAGETMLSSEYAVELINAGLNTLIVPIRSLPGLIALFPPEQALKAYCLQNGIDIILVFSKETENPRHAFHTRVFAPKFGYLEDPATGSGNSALGYYLLKHGLWDGGDISIEQGPYMHAFNAVKLKYAEEKVLFGGNAVTRIEGSYFI